MINKNALRSGLSQITVVTLALLAVGMIAWVGGIQSSQNIQVGNSPHIDASEDLWALVKETGDSSLAVDSVLSELLTYEI